MQNFEIREPNNIKQCVLLEYDGSLFLTLEINNIEKIWYFVLWPLYDNKEASIQISENYIIRERIDIENTKDIFEYVKEKYPEYFI